MHVCLFGPFQLLENQDGSDSALVLQPKRAAVLAYIAAAGPSGRRRRDALLAMFWPELDDSHARKALNQSLHYLRGCLGDDALVSYGDDQIGISAAHVTCDVVAFERALKEGRLEEALRQYRGDFMQSFFLSDLVEFERWVEEERTRLRQLAASAAWTLSDRAAAHDATAALQWAQRALEMSPMDERAVRRTIALYDRLGDGAGAIRTYDRFAAAMRDEYESAPSRETTAAIDAVRARLNSDAPAAAERAHDPPPALPPSDPAALPAGRPRVPPRALAAAAVIAILGSVVTFATWRDFGRSTPASGTVVIFPFAYSGSPESSYLSTGVARLLAADLDRSTALQSVDAGAVAAAVKDQKAPLSRRAAQRIVRRLGASSYVLGDVTESGGRIRITGWLYHGRGFTSSSRASVEGGAQDLFVVTDDLAAQFLRSGGIAGSGITDEGPGVTRSLPALSAFVEGESRYRAGRFMGATEAYQRAVQLDSTFALAFLRLSIAANWTGESQLADWASEQAMRLQNDLAFQQRLHVQAWHVYLAGDVGRAEPLYRQIVARDRSDIEAWIRLAEIGYHSGPSLGRPTTDSEAEWKQVLALDPHNIDAATHMARISARLSRRADFERYAAQIMESEPASDRVLELVALRAFAFGTRSEREEVAARLPQLEEPLRRAVVHEAAVASPDLDGVAELLFTAMRARRSFPNWEAGEMAMGAGALLARGRRSSAAALLDSAALNEPVRILEYRAATALVPIIGSSDARTLTALRDTLRRPALGRGASHAYTDTWRLYLLARTETAVGDTAAARTVIGRLEQRQRERAGPLDGAVDGWLAGLARVHLLFSTGQTDRALAALDEPGAGLETSRPRVWTLYRADARFIRGEILMALGRHEEAAAWYRTFPDPTAFDLPYLPVVTARLVQIARHTGDNRSADLYSDKLDALLTNADPAVKRAVVNLLKARP